MGRNCTAVRLICRNSPCFSVVPRGMFPALGTAWPRHQRATSRGTPPRVCCIKWSAITSRRSAYRPAASRGFAVPGVPAGARVRRRGDSLAAATELPGRGPCHARHNGFDLHAGLCVAADQRDRLERICRYALRPPVAQARLHLTDTGQVQLELRRPWADGTTHLLFEPVEPVELLERLAALTPRLKRPLGGPDASQHEPRRAGLSPLCRPAG